MTSLELLFCAVDDFCQVFEPQWQQQLLASKQKRRRRPRSLSLSEIMTILIAFHQSHYRNFKYFYLINVRHHWRGAFPRAVSYQRFVEWMPSTLGVSRILCKQRKLVKKILWIINGKIA
nr:hypothetical protein [[Leptolyngbya] sp. PCC 7376]